MLQECYLQYIFNIPLFRHSGTSDTFLHVLFLDDLSIHSHTTTGLIDSSKTWFTLHDILVSSGSTMWKYMPDAFTTNRYQWLRVCVYEHAIMFRSLLFWNWVFVLVQNEELVIINWVLRISGELPGISSTSHVFSRFNIIPLYYQSML